MRGHVLEWALVQLVFFMMLVPSAQTDGTNANSHLNRQEVQAVLTLDQLLAVHFQRRGYEVRHHQFYGAFELRSANEAHAVLTNLVASVERAMRGRPKEDRKQGVRLRDIDMAALAISRLSGTPFVLFTHDEGDARDAKIRNLIEVLRQPNMPRPEP